MKALLIVDMEIDFLPRGFPAVNNGEKIISAINNLNKRFDLIVASKDWQLREFKHFDKWPKYCKHGIKGVEFHCDLIAEKINYVFHTGSDPEDDCYSAFDANNTNIAEYHREEQVNDLYVCGLATEYCVMSIVPDALKSGFRTHFITDAIMAINLNPGDSDKAIEQMTNAGAIKTVTSEVK